MGTIEQGVRQAIDNCLRIQPGERVVIITDRQTREIGDALRAAAEKIVGDVLFFVMEDFGPRPIQFPAAMAEAIAAADVSIYAAQGAEGELQTFRRHMLKAVAANPKLRHAHMIGITPEIMCDGMCSDYTEIQRISKWVYEKVKDATSPPDSVRT
jgi:aminopeptidase